MWPGTSQPGPGSQGSAPRPASPPNVLGSGSSGRPRSRDAQPTRSSARTCPSREAKPGVEKGRKPPWSPAGQREVTSQDAPLAQLCRNTAQNPDRGFLAAFIHHQTPPGSSFRHSARRTPGARAAGACNPCSARGQDRGPGTPPPRSWRWAASQRPSGFTGLGTPPPQLLWRSAVPGSLPSAPLWPHSGHALVTLWSCPRSLRGGWCG